MLDEILLPGFDVEFIVEQAAARLHDGGVHVVAASSPHGNRVKADGPGTCLSSKTTAGAA
jgi:hypothetical protein